MSACQPQSQELELTDELSRHEITLQFAAFRVAKPEDRATAPSSLFFTYQFYRWVAAAMLLLVAACFARS